MAYLRGRDYDNAREKLKHALTAGTGMVNQSLLGRVVDVLEECPTPTLDDIAFIQTQMHELQSKLRLKTKAATTSTNTTSSTPSTATIPVQALSSALSQTYPSNPEDVFAVNAVRLGKVSMESNLDSRRFFEGQFYLKTYGLPEALVRKIVALGGFVGASSE